MPEVFTRKLIAAIVCTALAQQQERFPQLKVEDTSGAQRTLADRMLKETRAGLGGPWNVALRSPVAGQEDALRSGIVRKVLNAKVLNASALNGVEVAPLPGR